jgi:hypothetical protein
MAPDKLKELVKKTLQEMSVSGGGMGYNTPYAFKKTKNIDETAYGTGNLGPGPKASKDGVKDNYYVKAFGFTPVNRKKQAKASKTIDYKDLWGKTYK